MAFSKRLTYIAAPMLVALTGAAATTGCGEDGGPLGNLAAECGLSCPAEGVAEGNFAISGVAGVDSFFGAVVRLDTAAKLVTSDIQAQLNAIALSLDLEAGASIDDIKGALEAKISANVDGGLTIDYQAPKCEVSAQATIEATAKCDASVDPGSVKAECSGSCEAEVSASGEVQCDAEATIECKGTAPNFACEGTCEGRCELSAGATCEGTCNGTCNGTCSAENADGSCSGQCDGECEGSCELSAGMECDGACKGTCTYTPPEGSCSGGAKAFCKASASADAKVECSGKCEGEVTPPSASAECEASAKADAEVNASCTPPSLNVAFQFSADADADARAEFEVWLTGFKANLSALLAANAKADIVLAAAADLSAAASGAVTASVNAAASGDVNLKTSIGLACALTELESVGEVVTKATTGLSSSVSASAEIVGVVKS